MPSISHLPTSEPPHDEGSSLTGQEFWHLEDPEPLDALSDAPIQDVMWTQRAEMQMDQSVMEGKRQGFFGQFVWAEPSTGKPKFKAPADSLDGDHSSSGNAMEAMRPGVLGDEAAFAGSREDETFLGSWSGVFDDEASLWEISHKAEHIDVSMRRACMREAEMREGSFTNMWK